MDKRRQERLLVLNSKISKIIYFIEKCGSNVPPLHKLAWKNMLELLNEPLLEKDRLQIGPASWKNIEAYLSNAMLIREILIAKARKVIKSDPPIFKKLVRTAFTFHKVVPTLYPHFSSPSI